MEKTDMSTNKSTSREQKSVNEGYCLECGYRLSVCGRPFTADLDCSKCGAINRYIESYQPFTVIPTVEVYEVTVAA